MYVYRKICSDRTGITMLKNEWKINFNRSPQSDEQHENYTQKKDEEKVGAFFTVFCSKKKIKFTLTEERAKKVSIR